jgi:hypothetical protein
MKLIQSNNILLNKLGITECVTIILIIIILVKTCWYKIKPKTLMEDYKFFSNFLMNNELVTSVLCFGSHICNQAARIRVNTLERSRELRYNISTVGLQSEEFFKCQKYEKIPISPLRSLLCKLCFNFLSQPSSLPAKCIWKGLSRK